MSSYQDTKKSMMLHYPRLFINEADVLDHLFFVIGNGYAWKGGELVNKFEVSEEQELADDRKRRDDRNKRIKESFKEIRHDPVSDAGKEIFKEYNDFVKESLEDLLESDDPEVERAKEVKNRIKSATTHEKSCYHLLPDGSVGRTIYPLCEFSKILTVPDNVKSDWLNAAKLAIKLANSPTFKITKEDKKFLIKAKKRISKLLTRE